MQRWIAKKNIARFQGLLTAETDPEQRDLILNLLRQEEEKLRSAEAIDCAETGADAVNGDD